MAMVGSSPDLQELKQSTGSGWHGVREFDEMATLYFALDNENIGEDLVGKKTFQEGIVSMQTAAVKDLDTATMQGMCQSWVMLSNWFP